MNSIQIENFLGKNINETTFNEQKPVMNSSSSNYHSLLFKNSVSYYNNGIYSVFFHTDENDAINLLSLSLVTLIDDYFYNAMIETYGIPQSVLVADEIIDLNDHSIDRSNDIEVKKSFIKTKEGTFNENPILMIWEKKDYLIKVSMKYKNQKTDIVFEKK